MTLCRERLVRRRWGRRRSDERVVGQRADDEGQLGRVRRHGRVRRRVGEVVDEDGGAAARASLGVCCFPRLLVDDEIADQGGRRGVSLRVGIGRVEVGSIQCLCCFAAEEER